MAGRESRWAVFGYLEREAPLTEARRLDMAFRLALNYLSRLMGRSGFLDTTTSGRMI
jgi:hypothetical protein